MRLIEPDLTASAHGRNESEREKTWRNRAPKGTLCRRLHVGVNPLPVLGAFGKLVDALLVDEKPVAYADLLADPIP